MREESTKEGKITIKVNDRQTPFREEKKSQAKDLLENVKLETAASREEAEADFDWILPEVDAEPKEFKQVSRKSEAVIRPQNNYKKGNLFHTFGSLLFSIAFAIGLGIAFGLILLKFISGGEAPAAIDTNNPIVENEGQPTQPEHQSISAVTLPALTTYVIQGGIYSTQEAANTVSDQLSAKGIPSEMVQMDDGTYYLFLGIAGNESEAKQLASIYADRGAEVYAKAYLIEERTLNQINAKDAALLNESMSVLPILINAAGKTALGQGVTEDTLNKVRNLSIALQEIEGQNETVSLLAGLFIQSSNAIEKYSQTNSLNDAKVIQQTLLSYIKVTAEM